jgi:8-oxo-dGTP pyrophosphatase MutT (NUDIX family)
VADRLGRLRDPLLRLAFRIGYRLLQVRSLVARPPHRGVKCVLTRDREILLVRHTYGPRRRWELPGGGVKRREEPVDAARREIREELGIEIDDWTELGDLWDRMVRRRDRLWCFSAEIGDRPLRLDRAEIAEAEWFPRGRLPPHVDRYVSRIAAMSLTAR